MEQKEKLLKQIEDIQKKIDRIEEKKTKKISKLVMKHNLADFDEKILDQEFALLKEKLKGQVIDTKKNS